MPVKILFFFRQNFYGIYCSRLSVKVCKHFNMYFFNLIDMYTYITYSKHVNLWKLDQSETALHAWDYFVALV